MPDVSLKLGLEQGALQTGLKAAQGSVTGFANNVKSQLAAAFTFTAFTAGLKSAIDKGDQLQDIAEKFGLSASKLQTLGNAASVYGSGIENISSGLNKLSLAQQKALAGDTDLQDTFKEVGISLADLKSLSPEDVFLKVSDSFASGANDGRQFIIVNELLGKAQTDLIKVMNQGSAAILEQGTSMGVWSDETIAALSEASDGIKIFQNNITIAFGYIATLGNGLVKAFQAIVESVTLMGLAAKEAVTGNIGGARELVKAAGNVGNDQRAREAKPAARTAARADIDANELSTKEREQQEKALEQLKTDFREAANAREKRLDDEAHQDRMKQIDAELAKMDEAQKQKEQDRSLAARGLDAMIASREQANAPASAIASSLQQIGGGGSVNVAAGGQDPQLNELKRMRDNLTPLKDQIPQTLEEIRRLLAGGTGTLP